MTAKVVTSTDKETLQGFVKDNADPEATVYTADVTAHESLPFDHDTVKLSLWSMLTRAHKGTFHKLSPKHLNRYVQEFAGRHNLRELDTINIMGAVVLSMDGKRLKYDDLIKDNGLKSGARAMAA